MKYILFLFSLFATMPAMAATIPEVTAQLKAPTETIGSGMRSIEKKIRDASVRVTVPFVGGHGSGSYIKYKDLHLVMTAQHETSAPVGTTYLVSHKEESHIGILIYSDPVHDISLLFIANPFRSIEPMDFDPLKKAAPVGQEIFYSGYPSHHKLMSFAGRVAGYENIEGPLPGKHIILQTYGWFGCSGSVIYNTDGKIVGVLYGVDVEYYPDIQVQENLIWVAPINYLNIEKALKPFCRGFQGKTPKACK